MELIIILWLLAGSVLTNIMWIERDMDILSSFDLWKKEKNKNICKKHYAYAMILGLLLGPLIWHVSFYVRELQERLDNVD